MVSQEKIIFFQKGAPPQYLQEKPVTWEGTTTAWPFVLIDSCQRSSTKEMVKNLAPCFEARAHDKIISKFSSLAEKVKRGFENGEILLVKEGMEGHFELLKEQPTYLNPQIKNILKKNDLNLDVAQFFLYTRKSIESREYSKFVFTKYVDLVLKRISEIAKLKGLSKKQISFFSIKELTNLKFIKSSKKKLLNKIQKRESDYKTNLNIKLPLVLIDAKGVDVIPFQVSSPNFIGSKKIFSKIVFIDNNIDFKKVN